jgi:hypothetical protein
VGRSQSRTTTIGNIPSITLISSQSIIVTTLTHNEVLSQSSVDAAGTKLAAVYPEIKK